MSKPQVINNTLLVEDYYLNNFDQKDKEWIQSVIGQVLEIQAKTELNRIIEKTSLQDAETLISSEYNQDDVVITASPELGTYLIKLKSLGLHSDAPVYIILAIHRVYTGLRDAEEQVKYLKALGFGMHKEVPD